MSLGPWPVVNLAKARAKAAALDVAAYEGDDIWSGRKKAQRSSITFAEAVPGCLTERLLNIRR